MKTKRIQPKFRKKTSEKMSVHRASLQIQFQTWLMMSTDRAGHEQKLCVSSSLRCLSNPFHTQNRCKGQLVALPIKSFTFIWSISQEINILRQLSENLVQFISKVVHHVILQSKVVRTHLRAPWAPQTFLNANERMKFLD